MTRRRRIFYPHMGQHGVVERELGCGVTVLLDMGQRMTVMVSALLHSIAPEPCDTSPCDTQFDTVDLGDL